MAHNPAATEPAPQTHNVSVEPPNAKDMLITPALTRLLAVKMTEARIKTAVKLNNEGKTLVQIAEVLGVGKSSVVRALASHREKRA